LIVLRAETQQGSDIACAIEFLTFLDQVQLDIATDRHWNQGIAYIFQFESCAATSVAEANHVRIDVTATGAFDGVGMEVLGHYQRLHFPHL
jgi:hypothetical protein